MKNSNRWHRVCLYTVVACVIQQAAIAATTSTEGPADANEGGGDQPRLETITITTRKETESLTRVPTVVNVITMDDLRSRGITDLDSLSQIVPHLQISESAGALGGGIVVMRGISNAELNAFGDNPVSTVFDGVQSSRGIVRRFSTLDVQQIEVAKGPQALLYGKNSPAGVIVVRSNDPGDHLETGYRAGYEVEAHEYRNEFFLSTPVTDSLGVRVAGQYNSYNGSFDNLTPNGLLVSTDSKGPSGKDYILRATVKYQPSDAFSARLKVTYGGDNNTYRGFDTEITACPYGNLSSGVAVPCRAQGEVVSTASGPYVGALDPLFGDGQPYVKVDYSLGGLELNYAITDALKLASVTSFLYTKETEASNYIPSIISALPSDGILDANDYSQEFRLDSSFSGPLNFRAGAIASYSRTVAGNHTFLYGLSPASPYYAFFPPTDPLQVNNYVLTQKGRSYSGFGQLVYRPLDSVELAAGARYSSERKYLPQVWNGAYPTGEVANVLTSANQIPPGINHKKWHNISPELTASWHPVEDATLYGSYKEGFLSGGFNNNPAASPTQDTSFDQETVKGFEVGAKGYLLDHTLQANFAAYTYNINGLQASTAIAAVLQVYNVGTARVRGFESDAKYLTPVKGLSLRGAASYNQGTYTSFPNAPCYNGQTTTLGCRLTAAGATQDLSGRPMDRNPKWNLSAGWDYDIPLSTNHWDLSFSANATYTSRAAGELNENPLGDMPSYMLYDASLRLRTDDDRWEFGLVGRNLSDVHYYLGVIEVPFSGTSATGVAADDSKQRLADQMSATNPGRAVWLQLGFRFK
jgi:iron complex outermembrane receptor protein